MPSRNEAGTRRGGRALRVPLRIYESGSDKRFSSKRLLL